MSDSCCSDHGVGADGRRERRILWIALGVNAFMFLLEVVAGAHAGSSALQADALDFLGDASNYAVSLSVVAARPRLRARAALLKGASMGVFGLWVLGHTTYRLLAGGVPRAAVMGIIGVLALAANVAVLVLLLSFRRGDANRRSVWICSRNDVLGNVAVLMAASGVFATRSAWPDIVVAVGMASLALWGAAHVVAHARRELSALGGGVEALVARAPVAEPATRSVGA